MTKSLKNNPDYMEVTKYVDGEKFVSYEKTAAAKMADAGETHEWIDMGNGRTRLVRKNAMERRANKGVIVDSLGADLEHMGFSDGRKTDSKSVYRKWTKECGGVEMGNDRESRPTQKPLTSKDLTQDVVRSIDMLRNGYKPSIFNSREWE